LFVTLFLVLLILFTGGIFAIEKLGLFSRDIMDDVEPWINPDSAFAKKYPDVRRINVLVLGDTDQSLTDTIMLASFDVDLKRVDIVSVPRDTYFERPDHPGAAWQKINSVNKSEGIDAMGYAVSEVLGEVPIQYYAIFTDDDVRAIVDAMGGIEIDVPMDMKYTSKKHNLYIDLKKGKQTLDGDQAVQFLRFRKGYPTGDLGRVEAQQNFMIQAFKQSISLGFPKVAKIVADQVEANLKTRMAVRIAGEAVGMSSKDKETWITPGEPKTMNRASYFIVDEKEAVKMMNEIYSIKAEEE